MLEGLAAWILNTYIGEYVENLNTTQLSIGLLQGAVELENLPLKKDALKNFDLPLQVKSGFIGKITLQIPISRLRSEPWVVSMEKLYLLAGPLKQSEYDEEKVKKAEQAKKASMLEALEKKWQVLKVEKAAEGYGASWFSYGTSLATNILENLQLKIKDVHIRYEDDELVPNCPFAFGVTIKSLSAQSTDEEGTPKFVSTSLADMVYKLVDLQNFSCYLDTDAKMLGSLPISELADALHPDMYMSNSTGLFKDHEYILAPISAQTRLKRNTSVLPLRSPSLPRIALDMNLEKMAFCLSESQYRCVIQWLKELERHDRRLKHRQWRPVVGVKNNCKLWWNYAIQVNLHIIQERNKHQTKAYLIQRVKDVIKYHHAYMSFLAGEILDLDHLTHKSKMDEEWSYEELKILREVTFLRAKREGKLEQVVVAKEVSPAPVVVTSEEKPQEQKGVLQRWFPGWGGWYGTSDPGAEDGAAKADTNQSQDRKENLDDSSEEPPSKLAKTTESLAKTESQLEQELMDVIQDTSENMTFLKKDTVFARLNFNLDSGSFKLLCPNPDGILEGRPLVTLLELECTTISMMFESRPRTQAMKFGASVSGLYLRDKMITNTSFPNMISPQVKDRLASHSKSPNSSFSLPPLHIPKSPEGGPTASVPEEKIFQLMYEKNPANTNANYRVKIETKPLDIVYNPSTIRKIREFFSTKNMGTSRSSQLRLTAAARRQYEFLKEQTKAELKQTLDQILEGDEKRWDIKLDISAPQIIVPENLADVDTRVVVIDLGHLHVYNKKLSSPQQQDQKPVEENDDEFQTPLSTPPNEVEGGVEEAKPECNPLDHSLSESALFEKLYDKYNLELSDLQVMVGKMSDNWRYTRGSRSSTHFHVIDKLSLNLQFERRLIYTPDPEWPTTTLSGNMPCLTLHINEQKMLALHRCVETLSQPTSASSALGPDLSSSGSGVSMTESMSGVDLSSHSNNVSLNSSSASEKKMSDKMKEVLEDSRLMLAKFTINAMTLEVQSRGRPIVELQVTKVNANLTKRPYDTKVGLTVHSLLVVDALQPYGTDFELLVASHKNVTLDSRSGSIRGSEAVSPGSPMSPTSPHSPMETLNESASSTSLKVVQEAISKTFQALVNSGSHTLGLNLDDNESAELIPTVEEEALISIDLELINENSPSNTTGKGALQIATLQFNNLDIIGNQETIVELLSFCKTISPQKDSSFSASSTSPAWTQPSVMTQSPNVSVRTDEGTRPHQEVTAEFHRVSLLLIHLEDVRGVKHARKVATATMSSAKIQATLGKDLDLSGSLGGFHVLDITPDIPQYQQVFSVGYDSSEDNTAMSASCYQPSFMYKTAHESMFDEENESDAKALSFHYTRGMQRSKTVQNFSMDLDETKDETGIDQNISNLELHVASMSYIHSPRILHEISLCFSEFKEYMSVFAESIKTAAAEVAMEIISSKLDTSVIGSKTVIGDFMSPDGKRMSGACLNRQASMNKQQSFSCPDLEEQSSDNASTRVLLMNIQLASPVIVVPRSSNNPQAFVAQLGQISISNSDLSTEEQDEDEVAGISRNRMLMEMRDMNLCSVDLKCDLPTDLSLSQYSKTFMHSLDQFGITIIHNTTVQMIVDYIQPGPVNILPQEDTSSAGWCFGEEMFEEDGKRKNVILEEVSNILDISAKIATPLKVELSKAVYEQLLQTIDNMTYNVHLIREQNSGITAGPFDSSKTSECLESEIPDLSETTNVPTSFTRSISQPPEKPMTKRVQFEVPVFNVEMKGDFGEGEKGLVDLKLDNFLLKYEKSTNYCSNVNIHLESLTVEDLLENPDSPHRYLILSRAFSADKDDKKDDLKQFLSRSCPDSMIIAPTPIMPRSLPSSFHQELPPHTMLSPSIEQVPEPLGMLRKSRSSAVHVPVKAGLYPKTPPPSPMLSRKQSVCDTRDDTLVHISLLLVDKHSPEYVSKFDKTNRFVDVDFNCLEANINQQTWVVLLDFLGLGAKVHDVSISEPSTPSAKEQEIKPSEEEAKVFVNSVINLKVKSLSLMFNKPEYELARANISEWSSHIQAREGNFSMSGQLGNISLRDCSPHGALYRERFITVGKQALVFDFFKYGLPDPNLERDEDISLKLRMASVRYTHTNHFQMEFVAFIQNFLQLQDILGQMRAASAGKKVAEKASRGARITLDIEANAPIILIPHSSKSTDILVMNLGNLTVRNSFVYDGDEGTILSGTVKREQNIPTTTHPNPQPATTSKSATTASTPSSESSPSETHVMTQSLFDEFNPPQPSMLDPMTAGVYGSLGGDVTEETVQSGPSSLESYDPTDLSPPDSSPDITPEDSSVDMFSPSSSVNITSPVMMMDNPFTRSLGLNLENTINVESASSCTELTSAEYLTPACSSGGDFLDSPRHNCLLDVLAVELADMDLFSAERVEKASYNQMDQNQDLEFTDCVIKRQGARALKEKILLKLHIERNLENLVSHSAPDWQIQGALSSVHCSLDLVQYKLIRGILEHNLGEKLEEFKRPMMSHLQDPKIETVLSGKVWKGMSMTIDLNNVTLELLMCHSGQGPDCPESSVARLDFISSTFSFDSYSDQSKDVDLVSHEIVAYDTRYRDAPANVRPNVFEKILQNGQKPGSTSTSLQMELHYRATKESNHFMVLLHNMKLMCVFDWFLSLQEFLLTKPEDPFAAEREACEVERQNSSGASEESQLSDSMSTGSRAYSPLTVSQGIMTKRGPIVEQLEVPFEFKLNVTDTQFVVVEDSTSWDTNAVILKSTAVLSFRPKAKDKLMSCSLQSIEVFSCSLVNEEETALSIIDPLTITIDLNANPLPEPKPSSPGGIQDAAPPPDRALVLEVSFNAMNIRLSYHDMKMFLAILNSLPKQALQAKNRDSQKTPNQYPKHQIQKLQELGFSKEDCQQAWSAVDGEMKEAAVWLRKHCTPIPPPPPGQQSLDLTGVKLNANCFCLCFIDDCRDSDVPLGEIALSSINFHQKLGQVHEGTASFTLTGDFYNRALSGWEPFLEQWRCHLEWKKYVKNYEETTHFQINAQDMLNINITSALLEQYRKTKVTWTEDYYKHMPTNISQSNESPQEPVSTASQRRRIPFVPFLIHNQTGCPLWFHTVTTNPSKITRLTGPNEGHLSGSAYINASKWTKVKPGQQMSFVFHRKEKIRHKKTHELQINQLGVKVEGWHRVTPVTVDKVGVYFRHAEPDRKSATGLSGLTFESSHDPAKQQIARIVFDVHQEGSARKVITVRSALMVINKLDRTVDLKMVLGTQYEGNVEILPIPPRGSVPIPLPYIMSQLYMRPCDSSIKFCKQPIQWQHVGLAGQIKDKIMKCETSDVKETYRFCAAVKREHYPEQNFTQEVPVLPGHVITLKPPVIIHSLLPIDLNYYLKDTDISGTVKPGKSAALHAADPSQAMELGIYVENFSNCSELIVPPDTTYYKVKLRLFDCKKRKLELFVRIVSRKGGCVNLYIMAAYWLVNKSGLPLIFRQESSKIDSAGQFEEHELARSVTPLLFSYHEKELSNLCTMRVGKSVHGPNAIPNWCHRFSLESGTGMRKLYVVPKEQNRPDWLVELQHQTKRRFTIAITNALQVYNIGIEVRQGKGKYRDTNIVTFAPRFEIDNQSSHNLAIVQRHISKRETLTRSIDGHLTALPGCKLPFHWPRLDLDQLLCVRLMDVPSCRWSGGFRIDCIDSFHINMRTTDDVSHLLKVEVVMQGPTFFIVFGDAEEMPPPFRIDNKAEVPIKYYQTGIEDVTLMSNIKPHTSLAYAWDEPTFAPSISLNVQGGTSATYNMNKLEEGEKLYYQNFIYLAATASFNQNIPDENKQDLVLDCIHENHIVFKKKENGKRSQLWRMTTKGMLEHEGSMPPRDPRKQGTSSNRLVLDIADIAPQPGKMVLLTLRKIDERRKSTQKWSFMDGKLCCGSGVLCVQALGDFLQEGAVGVLGPCPPSSSVPIQAQMSSQRLHPGSGHLSVRVMMDGPIRVLEITDTQKKQVVQQRGSADDDGWEVYDIKEAEDKQGKIKDQLETKTSLELSMNLKGGLGISLVNKNAEELLYISMRNIIMDYCSTPSSIKMDISVASVQMDNQLFGTQRPVMLYVTPTSKQEGPDKTYALHMAVHKIPNTKWNADIYKHLFITMKKMSVQLEERLLWKIIQFIGSDSSDSTEEKVDQKSDQREFDTRKALVAATSVKSKRYYFGTLKINTSRLSLSMVTANKLSLDLQHIKNATSIPLVKFEDAKVDLDPFVRHHPFETIDFLTRELMIHYTNELKSQAAKILGSVDFLGNPLGLFNDVTEGISGLIKDGNVGGLLKNVTHGVSNSAAKFVTSLSDGVGTLNMDTKHNDTRDQIRTHSGGGGSHLVAGIKGFGYGLYGGLTSIVTQTYEGVREEGVEGLFTGFGKGMIGTVTKPVAGVLDLASGAANAVKDTSSSSSHKCPDRVRWPRCCHGPGGLLPSFSDLQARSQELMYKFNKNNQDEFFIALEKVRSGKEEGLKALITSKHVYFLRKGRLHPDNIMLQVSHREIVECKVTENNDRFYIELFKQGDDGGERSSGVAQKRPQIRCDKRHMAQRVSQQINYARNLFDEQRHTLSEGDRGEEDE
ncbi:intermembrane lipid transfer protein VPS13D-like [Ylistrum balloti]|uniref:intermembrane lipid transfer protein VPS13D-like n=1 Tax=Ylistrum balloti TaxID=509963 RepID=UPI002905E3F0|nr:intermembrane lipid transfer protein VPS13D-like [Ylistrum balloti]